MNYKPRKAACLALALCLLTAVSAAGQSTVAGDLASRLDSLMAHGLPAGSSAAVYAYDITADTVVYAYRADDLGRPASTMKLLTAITALSLPDADAPFRTEVWQRGTVNDGTLEGDLYVVGGFDPELGEEAIDSLVRTLSRQPYRRVRGRLSADVTLKDSLYYGAGWLWDDAPEAFQPRLSPLMLCKGAITIDAVPGATVGSPATLTVTPASTYYTIDNRTRSRTPAAGRYTVNRDWLTGGNTFTVAGNVDRRSQTRYSVASPADLFMHTLYERLAAAGLTISSPTTTADSPTYAYAEHCRDSTDRLVWCYETPARLVMEEMLKESDNLNAEAVLCRIGAQTTGRRHIAADDGLQAIRALIDRLGLRADDYRVADGCGLSHYDYLSPRLLVAFLRYAYGEETIRRRLIPALPESGVDGTLKYRMPRGTPGFRRVHAKTGTYTGVCCLAGYLTADAGHTVAFAIMNRGVLSARQARRLQDQVCYLLIRPTYALPKGR